MVLRIVHVLTVHPTSHSTVIIFVVSVISSVSTRDRVYYCVFFFSAFGEPFLGKMAPVINPQASSLQDGQAFLHVELWEDY